MLETELVKARDGESRRLMVVLHGLGDSMEGFRWLPEALDLNWMNYLLVNAPDPYMGGYSWYDIYGAAEAGIERSRGLLFELLDDLPKQGFAIDHTWVFGFSQGCLMTLEAGTRYPHRFAGLVGISGYVNDVGSLIKGFSLLAREQRYLVTHGTEDPLLPVGPVRQQIEDLQAAGLKIQWQEFRKVHTIAGEPEVAVIRDFLLKTSPRATSEKA